MTVVGEIIEAVLFVFIGLLWIRFVTGWVLNFARSWEPRGVLLVLLESAYTATDPPINGLRRVIKPLRIGNFYLDISFLLVLILAYVALNLNRNLLLY
ncbi:MAG TPA: YggT family protein [Nocardioides sp.]|nr:YggT family protein [Nocardioides sp.]